MSAPRAGRRPARPPWVSRKLGAALRFLERAGLLPMNSLRRRLSVTLALVLLAAGALLAASLQDFPRRLVEDYVLSRLHHDADLLYVRLIDAAAAGLGVDVTPRLRHGRHEEPAPRKGGVKVADVAELVNKLRNEAKVI